MATEKIPALALDKEGQGKRALITGIRGFTGRYLAAQLSEAGYTVFGTVLPGEEADHVNTFPVDLRDSAAVAELVARVAPDVVAHLAGIAFVAATDAALFYEVNLIGTRHLLAALAALARPPQAVLLASSANVYGNTGREHIDESTPPAPANDYAVSKLAMEHMAHLWQDKLPITIARPFNYTGVGQELNFLLPKIVDHFRRQAPAIELGNLAIARDFSDVRMVAQAYRRLLAVAPAGQTVNVCSGQAYALETVLDMMSRIAGYPIQVAVNPAFVRQNDVLRLSGSNDKLLRIVGTLDIPPLDQTLRWMYSA
ncbi:NAD-dependent epimerase/dehydratase family protein [Massilia sp. TS11]|uniref:NAD-dependent epimerase/dehydratase family protein n=1 Tax=Massilia sp. TS11 TaxID=2908003 RepID=UPI001EDA6B53|nr:GDP-mannose 4,6-dehydratase [Massilia sp. TS11]MCG2586395.1 GDP-mannose 4,6-dehydratase [Massilia sp. TS11]